MRSTHLAAFTSFISKPKKKISLLCVALAVLGYAASVRGQSALDGWDPRPNGAVRVVVVQPNGKILIGGDFTTLAPNGGAAVIRNRIARLNPDGTLDSAFDPNANGIVRTIALQADGKILVGGEFSGANSIGGQARNRIARLDAATGLADSLDPNATNSVLSIVVLPDGRILAGGSFSGANSIGGQTRNRIARLDPATGLADSFDPSANGTVSTIVRQADDKILLGGTFTFVGGQPRNRIARVDGTSGIPDSFDPNANSAVHTIALQVDGKILVGGQFNGASSIGGQTRNYIARLDAATGTADSFDPNANGDVVAIAVLADGRILAGGFFNGANSIGGQTRNRIARLDPATGLADTFDPNANLPVNTIAVQADGKFIVGGSFIALAPYGGPSVVRTRLVRLETDGRVDRTLDLSVVGASVLAIAVQPDGRILIGGNFDTVLGVVRNNMARLNTDGTLDTNFNPNPNDDANDTTGEVNAIVVLPDGKILVGGGFTNIGGQTRNKIARLDAVFGVPDSFDPNANGSVDAIALQSDSKILVGGGFTTIGGQGRNRIARLDPATGLADSFNPNASSFVTSIAVQADGKILVGGFFGVVANAIGGQLRNRIARLDPNTGVADSFNPNANAGVLSIAVQQDGKILVGGTFNGPNSIGAQTRNYIARLDPVSGLADSFDPAANAAVHAIAVQADGKVIAAGEFSGPNSIGGQPRNRIARLDGTTGLADAFDPNANGGVYAIALQADGKILTGGTFATVGSSPRNRFARLSNDTAALQNLAVTQTGITWIRSGSSPQLTRVTFEYSGDSVNFTPVGNGTVAGNDWILTGLNLPGGNSFLRARGYYTGGFHNGSESITESVRNVVFAGGGPTPTPTPTPTASPTPAPMTVQFSASNYSVNEGGLRVDITITRSGNNIGEASVNFTTSDTADAAPCVVDFGIASSRCDYETLIRRVQFAGGESSKTVSVFIIDDSYLEGTETFTVNLSNPSGATLSLPIQATVTITDNDGATGPNPIGTAGFFVGQHYFDFLNREGDPAGLAFWTNEITSCGANQACIDVKRVNVSAAFYVSIEFQQTGYLVHRIYKASYGDATGTSTLGGTHSLPVPVVRLNEFLPDTQTIGRGVIVGNSEWEQILEGNKQNFCTEFVQRSRFTSAFPSTMTPAQFVDALFNNAGVTPSATERQAAINEFGGTPTSINIAARGRVLRRVGENATLAQQEFNRAFVLMQYFGYLRRNPNDLQDNDYTGYEFWLNKLNQFNGNYVNAEMVNAFITSTEYRQRFGP